MSQNFFSCSVNYKQIYLILNLIKLLIFSTLILNLSVANAKTHLILDQTINENETRLHPYILRSKNSVQNLLKAIGPHQNKLAKEFADVRITYSFSAYEDKSDIAIENMKLNLQHQCMDALILKLIENPNSNQKINTKVSFTLDLDRSIIEEQNNKPFSTSNAIQDYQIIEVVTEIVVDQCQTSCEEKSGEFSGRIFKSINCQSHPVARVNWKNSYSPQLIKE